MRMPTRCWLVILAATLVFGLGLLVAVGPGVAADKDEKVTPEQKAAREEARATVEQIADMIGDEKKAEDIQKKAKELAERMMKADFGVQSVEQMDVLVNASDPEPFGIVLLEGMARSVAVLAVNSGGPSEFIEDAHTGTLARSGEPSALADALEPLLASPALRRTLGEAGHARYLEQFTDAAMRRRFFSALEAVRRDGTTAASESR